MAGLSSISGLVAGFSTRDAVEELLGYRKFEISQLTKKQEAETAKQAAFTELNTLLTDFRNISTDMRDTDKFFAYTASLNSDDATVPASSLLDVTGDNSVTSGNHNIIVNRLAQAERLSSSAAVKDFSGVAVTSDASSLNLTGSFQLNGIQIDVTSSNSLADIANNINNQSTGVTASVIKVSDSNYRLILAADETGATGFTLSGADLDGDVDPLLTGSLASLQMGSTAPNQLQTLQTALDAEVVVDGLTINRSSNTISDVLSGITFTLKQENPAVSVNMAIGVDSADVRANVEAFVDAYNAVASYVNDQFTVNADTGDNGLLAGESILTSIQNTLTSTLLQSVSGLASDRDSLVEIGIEPDRYGKLTINDDRFLNFLNTEPDAIRDLFVAQGSSTTQGLEFLIAGDHTESGTYNVNVLSVASQASLVGNIDLVNASLSQNQAVTITEAGNGRQAIVDLLSGDFQSDIISKLNTEFAKEVTEQRVFDVALLDGVNPATSSSLFSSLGAGVAAGDSISISGTNRSGVAISATFSVLDPTQDRLSDLISAIQAAFEQQVTASIDANGRIQVKDNSVGDSKLSVTLSSDNQGGGSLSFGVDDTALTTEGRYVLSMEAIVSGNNVMIQHKSYGSSAGFSISQDVNGLGISDNAGVLGTHIVGTINDKTAIGKGQILVSTEGDADGVGVLYNGNATAPFTADMVIGIGVAASFDGKIDVFSNPFLGFIQNNIWSSQDVNTSLEERIADLERNMDKQRVTLTRAFSRMESVMNLLQGQGNFLTQQIDASNASR